MSGIEIEEFKPLLRNSLRGFIRVRLPSGMILHDVAVHQSNGSAWASPPSKPMIGRDGVAMRDQNSKIKYQPIVEFSSKELRDKFSRAVIEALRAMHPEALADGNERLPPAARRLLQRGSDALITFEEAWAACPWRSILGCGRNADELLHQLGATLAIVDHDREPLSADVLADVLATLARGESVLLIAARRADRDFAKAQIMGMAAGARGRA